MAQTKIYTLKNYVDSPYGTLDGGPIVFSSSANSSEQAASMASKELDGMWVNPGDFEVHDDPAYSKEGKRYRANERRKKAEN